MQENLAACDFVFRRVEEATGQGALAATVGSHDGVNFAGVDRDVESLQDVGGDHGVEIVGGGPGMQVDNLEKGTTHMGESRAHPLFLLSP